LFACPEDAVEQMRQAVEFHRAHFGREPQGMWPSEGAVGEDILHLLPPCIRWLASDEGVLARSLGVEIQRDGYGQVTNPQVLYQPYLRGQRSIVFRDHILSDLIGFTYQQMPGQQAAEDLVNRLHHIRHRLPQDQPYLVSIILDGENCWDNYEHNGDVFLRRLYALLSDDPQLKAVTVSEYLAEHPAQQTLDHLFTGSWINHNLETWIGEPAQNRAWECLAHTRQQLLDWQGESPLVDEETLQQAWREVYIAEGSDWFWWYCGRNYSPQEHIFDCAFRAHLGNVYTIMGLPVPRWLSQPIAVMVEGPPGRPISAYIAPRLSTTARASADWAGAGLVEQRSTTGAMQRGKTVLRRLYYGYNPVDLYLRLESQEALSSHSVAFYLAMPGAEVANSSPRYPGANSEGGMAAGWAWEVAVEPQSQAATLSRADGRGGWQAVTVLPTVAVGGRVLELAVPLAQPGLQLGDEVSLTVVLSRDGVAVETLPGDERLHFILAELGT
jgi:hypothetical protein